MRLTRRILSLIPLLLLPAASLFAQSERKPEVFFGYSNLQGQGLQDQNGLFNNRATLHGFDTEVTPFLGDRFGITGDFSFNENGRSDSSTTFMIRLKRTSFISWAVQRWLGNWASSNHLHDFWPAAPTRDSMFRPNAQFRAGLSPGRFRPGRPTSPSESAAGWIGESMMV